MGVYLSWFCYSRTGVHKDVIIKQGDPISPFFFTIAADVLIGMVVKVEG